MRVLFSLAVVALVVASADARPRRGAGRSVSSCSGASCSAAPSLAAPWQSVAPGCSGGSCAVPSALPTALPDATPAAFASSAAGDGLDEVNAKRAARGLRPFVRDEALTRAAHACAEFRARHGLFGHTTNDFGFLPPGATASAAGCAAYPAHYGWMSCCTYDGYTHGGAAWVTGGDGKRYMHLFVR